jgi:hypothetical protein
MGAAKNIEALGGPFDAIFTLSELKKRDETTARSA